MVDTGEPSAKKGGRGDGHESKQRRSRLSVSSRRERGVPYVHEELRATGVGLARVGHAKPMIRKTGLRTMLALKTGCKSSGERHEA